MLRIAHVTATFPPYKGGTGNVVWHLTRELAARGHDVHVLTAKLGGRPAAPPGVSVRRFTPLVRIGNAPALPSLAGALRHFDVVHLHYPFYFGAETVWAAASWFGIPYVVTYHNDVRLEGFLRVVPPIYHRLIGARILANAGAVFFTTLDYARSSDAAALVGRANVYELGLGVDTQRFRPRPTDQALRQRFGVGPDAVLVVFVAALDRAHYFKGLPVVLEALQRVSDLPLHLLVVGDGDLRPLYEQKARASGIADRVHFAGTLSDTLLPGLYATADLLVLASTTRGEAFGLVLLEAMAAGKPVIASDLPGVREVVRRTRGGFLVRPGEAGDLADGLRRLALNPSERISLGQAGLQAVREQYQWPQLAARLEHCYLHLADQST